jgi:hypothetical protein
MFCALFRASVTSSLEYSLSDDPDTFGTMVRGDAGVLDAVGAFVLGTPFAGAWYSAAVRSFRRLMPVASLFRVDWRAERPVATTLYMKFPHAPTDSALRDLLSVARPFGWHGPSPVAVAAAVGLAGPTGIGLRGTASGAGQVALYYLIETARGALKPLMLRRLLATIDMSGAERIVSDSVTLASSCPLSVIGLDGGSTEGLKSLKMDWGEVPIRVARALVASMGASPRALVHLNGLSNHLRARWLSYLSLKYASTGFAGWRAYFSTEPYRCISAGLPSLQGRERYAGARMPHY